VVVDSVVDVGNPADKVAPGDGGRDSRSSRRGRDAISQDSRVGRWRDKAVSRRLHRDVQDVHRDFGRMSRGLGLITGVPMIRVLADVLTGLSRRLGHWCRSRRHRLAAQSTWVRDPADELKDPDADLEDPADDTKNARR
jgi:hypothetical protein